MEIVDFSSKYFQEIPEQDNPAFSDTKLSCIMLVKSQSQYRVGKGVTVLRVDAPSDIETVTSLGHFYKKENAELFANSYKEQENE